MLRWSLRIVRDIVWLGHVNQSYALSVTMLFLLLIGLFVIAAHVSAPFIYTLF